MRGTWDQVDSPRQAVSLQLRGLVYLAVLIGLIWLSIAVYQKKFTAHVEVQVVAARAGQQLNVGGDVRMNGAIIGRVSDVDIDPQSRTARVTLQLEPESAERIPRDVQARILPTTLFGQKFVELTSSSSTDLGLTSGQLIPEDRSAATTELTEVIDELDQVLSQIDADQLAVTLGAVSRGLEGRGDDVRQLMREATIYLRTLNQNRDLLIGTIDAGGDVAQLYSSLTPAFLSLLRNGSVTADTLVANQDDAETLLRELEALSQAGSRLLATQEDRLAFALEVSRPTTELLARYAPAIECTIDGFLGVERSSAVQIRDNSFQGNFTLGEQYGGYTLDDALVLGDLGAGPNCAGLPNPPVPYPAVELRDGVEDDRVVPSNRSATLPTPAAALGQAVRG